MTDILDRASKETIIREVTRMTIERITEELAGRADEFAKSIGDISGADALRAFASAIRSTNRKTFPGGLT